jgi:hypothetical protein
MMRVQSNPMSSAKTSQAVSQVEETKSKVIKNRTTHRLSMLDYLTCRFPGQMQKGFLLVL